MMRERLRRTADWLPPRSGRHRIALAWAVVTFAIAAATAPSIGVSRDEGALISAGESAVAGWKSALTAPRKALRLIDRSYEANREHPGLAKLVYGLTHALLSPDARGRHGLVSHLQGFRIGAFFLAALLSYLLALGGRDLAGRGGALVAPALFWLVPRHFHQGHLAALDMPVAALWLATVHAYRMSLDAVKRPARRRRALLAALLFGAAVSVEHTAWLLLPVLLGHALLTELPLLRNKGLREWLRIVPSAIPAMAVIGPIVFFGTWPWLWHDSIARVWEYAARHLAGENRPWMYLGTLQSHPPYPIVYPFVVTALTVPATLLVTMTGGLVHTAARLVQALRLRRDTSEPLWSDELLLIMNGLLLLVLVALPGISHFGTIERWMTAMPFLALMGARVLVAAGRALWPSRATAVTAVLAILALAPALEAVVHVDPFGTASYSELAGGTAGAADLGMQRQWGGENVVAALGAVNAHAVPRAGIWYEEATQVAIQLYQRDGMLRRDLRWADNPESADISVYHCAQESRAKEYAAWTQFRTAQPVAGVYLDEVPLVQVYARAGAWR